MDSLSLPPPPLQHPPCPHYFPPPPPSPPELDGAHSPPKPLDPNGRSVNANKSVHYHHCSNGYSCHGRVEQVTISDVGASTNPKDVQICFRGPIRKIPHRQCLNTLLPHASPEYEY